MRFYQDHVGIFAVDTVELFGGELLDDNGGSSRHGPRSTMRSYSQHGPGCKAAAYPLRLSRSDRR